MFQHVFNFFPSLSFRRRFILKRKRRNWTPFDDFGINWIRFQYVMHTFNSIFFVLTFICLLVSWFCMFIRNLSNCLRFFFWCWKKGNPFCKFDDQEIRFVYWLIKEEDWGFLIMLREKWPHGPSSKWSFALKFFWVDKIKFEPNWPTARYLKAK